MANPRSSRRKGEIVPPALEQVRERAYAVFQARRGGPGDALSDWLQAERELNRGTGGGPTAPAVGGRPLVSVPSRAEVLLHGAK